MTNTNLENEDAKIYGVKAEHRAAHESTNDQLGALAGLLEATDLFGLSLQSHSVSEKAFFAINRLACNMMAEIWDLRNDEWVSIGGRSNRED